MILETKRCYLRNFKEEDIDNFILYRNNLDWMIYQNFKGMTVNEYKSVLLSEATIYDGVQIAIICKDANELIGDIYLSREDDTCYIGYTITPEKARLGFASEVVLALTTYLSNQGIKTIKAGVDKQNIASINLLKKLNFLFDSSKDGDDIYKLDL